MITLINPLCFLDAESATAGPRPDPAKDKLLTLSVVTLLPDMSRRSHAWYFNPGFEMTEENISFHGISNEKAATYPTMTTDYARDILRVIAGQALAGFNLANYDIPLIWEELFRVGVVWDVADISVVDVGNIFKKKEERTLSAAVKFYLGREHCGAHNSNDDVDETINVFGAQLERYKDLAAMTVGQLHEFSRFDERVDLAGKIIKGPDGDPIYNFGKDRGQKVVDNPGFGRWMLTKDFSENTKQVLRKILRVDSQRDLL